MVCPKCNQEICICKQYCFADQACRHVRHRSFHCAGPAHLTGEWDIMNRPCCGNQLKKMTTTNGYYNYCSYPGTQPSNYPAPPATQPMTTYSFTVAPTKVAQTENYMGYMANITGQEGVY